jgi:hypothetical protein
MFSFGAHDPLESRAYTYKKEKIHFPKASIDLPPFVANKFDTFFVHSHLCIRCNVAYKESENFAHLCSFHPNGIDRLGAYMCCGESIYATPSFGCTPCDHAENVKWTYGESAHVERSPSVIQIPLDLMKVIQQPKNVLATVTSFDEETRPVVYQIFVDKLPGGLFKKKDDLTRSFIPAETPSFSSLNDHLRYEKEHSYYETFKREFIGYVVIQRF